MSATRGRRRVCGWLAACAAAVLPVGCVDPLAFFNPAFLQAAGLGDSVANLPGEAPTIILEVENQAGRVIEYFVSWRDGDGNVSVRTGVLAVGDKYSESVFCPIDEMTLGDVGDLTEIGALVRLGAGEADDPVIEVEPFGSLLQDSVNYNCGDSVTFTVLPSAATLSGYQTYAFIRRAP